MNDDDSEPTTGRSVLIGLALSLAAASTLYQVLVFHKLQESSALYIGLPTVLAILLAYTPRPESAKGLILKGMTAALLLSGILLGEGLICIVMAAPLFYLVGFVIGCIVDIVERRRDSRLYGLILLPFASLSLEGTHPSLSFQRDEEVTVERIVPSSPEAVERRLSAPLMFDGPLPVFLRLRFPRPEAAWGEGLETGDYRAVRFTGPDEPPGILVLRVCERSPGFVSFQAESDTSMIAHWLDWKSAEVRWEKASARTTRVRWTLRYRRRLDPAWYFGPWERYAAHLAAVFLIESAATPREAGTP